MQLLLDISQVHLFIFVIALHQVLHMQRQIFLAGFFVFLICQLLVRLHRLECAFRARCASDRGESLDEETLNIPGWLNRLFTETSDHRTHIGYMPVVI
jgi:hypothetical protein